ncbi:MAG: hypothetical protein IE926_01810 [Micrococcales bacterium]|nr:hypothetical protein [Micrococcales bacterium]
MKGRETGEVLDDIDAALDDYVEWHGSVDSASWTADGSHEVTTGGEYYALDEHWQVMDFGPWFEAFRAQWAEIAARTAAVIDALVIRTVTVNQPRRYGHHSIELAILDELNRTRTPEPEPAVDPLAALAAEALDGPAEFERVHAARFTDALSRALAANDAPAGPNDHRTGVRAQSSPYGPRQHGGR